MAPGAGSSTVAMGRRPPNNRRAQVRDGSGLSSWVTVSRTTPVQLDPAQYGPNYLRQDMIYEGTNWLSQRVRGEASMDFSFGNGACGERLRNHHAPKTRFSSSLNRLRAVQNTISYFGTPV